ncbi:CD209 antigen-like isoform X3 [Ctenopharyngodon idella]|uniref:CD209 antigen-like isoform X3 n=1 Tax=Ctenopharyngodon idella TaxID=7959 RepID=UPI0022300366|nr:CD209 antigen-like isoform X3 [Ctenopharyngodon idella]
MELEGIYKNVDRETCSKGNEQGLGRDEDIYANKDQKLSQTEARAQNQRGLTGRSKCVVLSTVCFGLMCILLVATIIVLQIKLTAERETQATHMLQTSSRYQTEMDQLQNSFNSLSQKKLELETRVKDLIAEKSQLQRNFDSLSQKKLELDIRVSDLTAEKNLSESRVKDLTAEKSLLQQSFDSSNQKKLELETRVNDLTAEKSQLQSSFNSLNQKKLELETELRKLSEQAIGCLVASNEEKSWSDSRKYCRDRGGDLVIINTEEKQRCISSFTKEIVWIGLSDIENEGNMKWVDNSPLKQGFWEENEPNDAGGKEDCIELNPGKTVLNNWNDIPCSAMRKSVCEI